MTSEDSIEVSGRLVQKSDYDFIFYPSDFERTHPISLKVVRKRERPIYLKSVPFGFLLQGQSTTRNDILSLLWDLGPLTSREVALYLLPRRSLNSVYKLMSGLVRLGDLTRTEEKIYSLPGIFPLRDEEEEIEQESKSKQEGTIKDIRPEPESKQEGSIIVALDNLINEELERCGASSCIVIGLLGRRC